MNVKVQDAKRLDFFDLPRIISNEQVSLANLEKSNHLLALSSHVQPMVRCEQLCAGGDNLGQPLSLGRGLAHPVDDLVELLV